MSQVNAWVDAWIKVLRVQESEVTEQTLSPDILVLAYHAGVGGPETRIEGRDAVYHWITRAPKDQFIFERTSAQKGTPTDRLPAGELFIDATYRLSVVGDDFTNTGRWKLVIAGNRIAGVLHEPQPV